MPLSGDWSYWATQKYIFVLSDFHILKILEKPLSLVASKDTFKGNFRPRYSYASIICTYFIREIICLLFLACSVHER